MLKATALSKTYETAAGPVRVLANVDLILNDGEAISIMGPSGCGKSTLLHILGLLDPPTSGSYSLDEVEPWTLDEKEQARIRNSKIGFIFQDHCLLPQCTVLENVLAPLIVGERDDDAESRARDLLQRAGLGERLNHFPSQLSGGEKQRVAIVRAIIRNPALLLCDEPTGNLDEATAWNVLELLAQFRRDLQCTLIIVTHSAAIAAEFPKQFAVHGGQLVRTA